MTSRKRVWFRSARSAVTVTVTMTRCVLCPYRCDALCTTWSGRRGRRRRRGRCGDTRWLSAHDAHLTRRAWPPRAASPRGLLAPLVTFRSYCARAAVKASSNVRECHQDGQNSNDCCESIHRDPTDRFCSAA